MATRVVMRGASLGGKQWGGVVYCVERDVPGEPGTVEFHRYSDKDEAFADAAEDAPASRSELTTDEAPECGPSWRL